MNYSTQLLRFIGQIGYDLDGRMLIEGETITPTVKPFLYKPNVRVGLLSQEVLKRIQSQMIKGVATALPKTSLIPVAKHSGLEHDNPYCYHLLKHISLEAFAVTYALKQEPALQSLISERPLARAFTNTKYILSVIGGDDTYNALIQTLHDLIISLGYLRAQVPVIKGGDVTQQHQRQEDGQRRTSTPNSGSKYKKHTIQQGDTVQSISQAYFGVVTEWRRIMQYNSLKYPYIVSREQKLKNPERFVTIGDIITIPIETSFLDRAVDDFGKRDRELVLSLALGKDISMIANERHFSSKGTSDEILELSANSKGDIQITIGVENLKQAVIARLLTPRGSLLMHPDYGSELHLMFGRATQEQAKFIEIEFISTIKKDGRIGEVTVVESYVREGQYYGEFTVEVKSIDTQLDLIMASSPDGNFTLQ